MSQGSAGTFLNKKVKNVKKSKKVKKYPGAEPKCKKKVHAILNSIVDFADFSRKSDGEMLFAL